MWGRSWIDFEQVGQRGSSGMLLGERRVVYKFGYERFCSRAPTSQTYEFQRFVCIP